MRAAFLPKQNETPFLGRSVWQMGNKFGKKCALKFGVLIVGEIEQQSFHAPATFR